MWHQTFDLAPAGTGFWVCGAGVCGVGLSGFGVSGVGCVGLELALRQVDLL